MMAASQLKENAMKKLSIALVCALIVPMFASVADARGRDKPDFHYEGTITMSDKGGVHAAEIG
jgi:hypothetical protein